MFLLNLNIFYSAYSDEFNFNVTEIEITDNGNIIRGNKGGVVNSKNNEITMHIYENQRGRSLKI